MLDNLPPWLRHLAIVFGATFALFFTDAIVRAGGILPFPCKAVAVGALNSAATATAAVAVLWLTTLTRQYGVGNREQ